MTSPSCERVEDEVVDVAERGALVGGQVLAVHGGDRDHGPDVEAEVEFERGVVGVAGKAVECRRERHRLAAA